MTATLPIQAVNAVLRIAELPGMHVVHAPADENSDANAWAVCDVEAEAGAMTDLSPCGLRGTCNGPILFNLKL
jgi:hypothetical protein